MQQQKRAQRRAGVALGGTLPLHSDVPCALPPQHGQTLMAVGVCSWLWEYQSDLPCCHPRSRPAMAVLPFVNMRGDLEQEYFSDEISEDIITALCRYPSLFTFKGRSVDVKQVGHALGVRYVLEGSLRKAGNRIPV